MVKIHGVKSKEHQLFFWNAGISLLLTKKCQISGHVSDRSCAQNVSTGILREAFSNII